MSRVTPIGTTSLGMAVLAIWMHAAFMTTQTLADEFKTTMKTIGNDARTHLEHGVMAFWADHAPDPEYGGFLTHLDRNGQWTRTDRKHLLMHARLIWTFSAAHRMGLRNRDYKQLADDGIAFVEAHFRDQVNDGYITVVDREGNPVATNKSTYHLSFLIYAYSEHFLATREPQSLSLAESLFDTLQSRCLDPLHPGYIEDFEADWTIRDRSELGPHLNVKTLNTHMHLLECYINLYRASGNARHKEALITVRDLILEKTIAWDKDGAFAYEPFNRNWEPIPYRDDYLSTSYSHNVELAWFLQDASDALGEEDNPHRETILGLINYALIRGFDWQRGGVAPMGPVSQSVLTLDPLPAWVHKSWWDQAELLVALCYGLRLDPGNLQYQRALESTWSLVWNHFIDPVSGEWFPYLDWTTLEPLYDYIGSEWKTCYHNGRALMMLDAFLRNSTR
jgi:mannose 2-epimerase